MTERFTRGIIVLGRKLLPDGSPTPILIHRVACAVEVYKKHKTEEKPCAIICSGGIVMKKTRPEAHVMRELFLSHGIPDDHIFMDDKACNTPENMIFSRRILDSLNIKHVILITSDFHMERAKAYAQAFIPPTEGFIVDAEEDHPPMDDMKKQEIEKEKKSITYVSERVRKYSGLLRDKKV